MNEQMKDELWSVIAPRGCDDVNRQKQMIESLLVNEDPLLLKLRLIEYLSNPSDAKKVEVQLAILKYWRETLRPDRFIFLVSFLAVNGFISLKKAASFLRQIGISERKINNPNYEKAVEMAEIVLHDEEEGFVKINADDLFFKALKTVVQ